MATPRWKRTELRKNRILVDTRPISTDLPDSGRSSKNLLICVTGKGLTLLPCNLSIVESLVHPWNDRKRNWMLQLAIELDIHSRRERFASFLSKDLRKAPASAYRRCHLSLNFMRNLATISLLLCELFSSKFHYSRIVARFLGDVFPRSDTINPRGLKFPGKIIL